LRENQTIPEGFGFVPIRQLVQFWNKTQFVQGSRAVFFSFGNIEIL